MIPFILYAFASQAFYLFPPFSRICLFYISYPVFVIMLFCSLNFTLYFISPKFINSWIFAMSDKRSLPFKDPFFNFISYLRAVSWMFSHRPLRRNLSMVKWRSDINLLSFSSQLSTELQSFCVIHLPNVRQALSLILRIFIFLTVGLFSAFVIGLDNIEKWSEDPIFGNWDESNSFGLFVKKQSRIPESLVLNFTSWLRWFTWAISLYLSPVVVGLKSPVIITRAFGCLDRIKSGFFCMWSFKTMFSSCRFLVEW